MAAKPTDEVSLVAINKNLVISGPLDFFLKIWYDKNEFAVINYNKYGKIYLKAWMN